jgi:hypothetical protein
MSEYIGTVQMMNIWYTRVWFIHKFRNGQCHKIRTPEFAGDYSYIRSLQHYKEKKEDWFYLIYFFCYELLHTVVGWAHVGTSTSVWRRFVGFHEKVRKTTEKKCFGQQISRRKVMEYIDHPVHMSQKFFLQNIGFMGIKKRRILRRFQKYQFIVVAKCT